MILIFCLVPGLQPWDARPRRLRLASKLVLQFPRFIDDGKFCISRHLKFSILFVIFSTPCTAIAQQTDEAWKLVCNDEFDAPALDYSKWEIEVNAFGGGNNELQIYTDRKENVRVYQR